MMGGYSSSSVQKVGGDAILGIGCVIFGDAGVGVSSVIEGNAVVTHGIPVICTVAGVPARVVRYQSAHELLTNKKGQLLL